MRFEHISYENATRINSKQVETYNFHKAAAVLAEYGFDCSRLADDWKGAEFLAHHKNTEKTLEVQLKSCLVINEKYLDHKDLCMCFPLDGTGNWCLVEHAHLMEIAREKALKWFDSALWKQKKGYWSWAANEEARCALEDYVYKSSYGGLGFRECTAKSLVKERTGARAYADRVSRV